MTRHLSELLQAPEPTFRLQLRQLEQVSGHQNLDIKLSVQIMHAAQDKLRRLGLDRLDTSPEELYQALLSRLSADDARLERTLRTRAATHISAEADLMAGMLHAVEHEVDPQTLFAVKAATVKRLLKKQAPKRLQKMLGYRSLDAMLRAESPTVLVAFAMAIESAAWLRAWRESYKRLQPADFDDQAVKISSPTGKRWQPVTAKVATTYAHTVLSVPELATIVILPLPNAKPAGMVIATVALALHEYNSQATTSNYLRASQMEADFGNRVVTAAKGDVHLQTPLFSQAMNWRMVQRYFAKLETEISEDIFGPYIEQADFRWHDVEQLLSQICPSLAFWEGSSFISFIHEGQAVSCNLLDAAINCCNKLAYEARSIEHVQAALWSELALRYLDYQGISAAVTRTLRPQLAPEMAIN